MIFAAIKNNKVQKFKKLLNEELVQMRDARGLISCYVKINLFLIINFRVFYFTFSSFT